MLKGTDIVRYERVQTGVDGFGSPIYSETAETLHNVLIGEPSTEEVVAEMELYGKHIAYTLALPKGDTRKWDNVTVEFFGQKFRTYGAVVEGIEGMIPLSWNRKVKVERYG